MLQQYAHLFLFLLLGISVSVIAFNLAAALRPASKDPQNDEVYECGMDPVGTPWVSPNIRFYTIALVFVAFDVEALYIFPWAVELRSLGIAGFIEMMTFIGILAVGLLFAWKKGALTWD